MMGAKTLNMCDVILPGAHFGEAPWERMKNEINDNPKLHPSAFISIMSLELLTSFRGCNVV